MDTEHRSFAECRIEAADHRTLAGTAIVFGVRSVDLGGFQEIIAPEAVEARSMRFARRWRRCRPAIESHGCAGGIARGSHVDTAELRPVLLTAQHSDSV
jgi:hypothetical protein